MGAYPASRCLSGQRRTGLRWPFPSACVPLRSLLLENRGNRGWLVLTDGCSPGVGACPIYDLELFDPLNSRVLFVTSGSPDAQGMSADEHVHRADRCPCLLQLGADGAVTCRGVLVKGGYLQRQDEFREGLRFRCVCVLFSTPYRSSARVIDEIPTSPAGILASGG